MRILPKKTPEDVPRRRQQKPEQLADDSQLFARQFRRGRTLTGSSSPKVASSNELQADMLSPRAQVHHLSRHRNHLLRRFLIVGMVALALYLFMGQLVASVTVAGAEIPAERKAQYAQRIDEYLAARPNERFMPSLNHATLRDFVQAKHPEVQRVTLSLAGEPGQAEARIALRQPVARWTIDGQTQFVDATGVVYPYNHYRTPALEIVDKTGASSSSGIVASNRFLSFVGRMVGDLKARGYTVSKATIPALTSRQLELTIRKVPHRFKLTVDRPAGEQAEDIARVIGYFKQRGQQPKLVDVRVAEKAYYK